MKPRGQKKWNAEETEILERLVARGARLGDIARALNRTPSSVTRKIQRARTKKPASRPERRKAEALKGNRACLSCKRKFISEGIGNRICPLCKEHDRSYPQLYEGVSL